MGKALNSTRKEQGMITIAERREMKRMGYTIKVNYERPNRIRFLKYFTTKAEADDFTEKAAEHNIHPISRDTIEEAKRQHDGELEEMRRVIR